MNVSSFVACNLIMGFTPSTMNYFGKKKHSPHQRTLENKTGWSIKLLDQWSLDAVRICKSTG